MSAKNAGAPAPTAHDAKRALIDDLEHSRHAGAPSRGGAETAPGEGWRKGELVAEVERLRDEVARARANDGMLAASLRQMEDRALAAIAEAGKLKTRWEQSQAVAGGAEENARLAALLRGKQEENRLLTEALAESENEISRLTRALEMAVEQLV